MYCLIVLLLVLFGPALNFADARHLPLTCSEFLRNLGKGARGADVSSLQTYLAHEPDIYPEGLVTGYFGELTQKAVERFQAKHGIVSSGSPESTGFGFFGPRTRAKAIELCKAQVALVVPAPTPSTPLETNSPQIPPTSNLQPLTSNFIDLKANDSDGPIKVPYGSSVTLSWVLADRKWSWCNKQFGWSGSIPTPKSGSEVIDNMTYTRTFKLQCYIDNDKYEDEVVVAVGVQVPPPLPPSTTTSTPISTAAIPYNGAFGKIECTLRVRPAIAYLDKNPPDAIWEVYSSPTKDWHFYWHEIQDGVEKGHTYGGQTNKVITESYSYKPTKITRWAHVVIDQKHYPDIYNPNHPDTYCTTETVDFEIRETSPKAWLRNSLASIYDAVVSYIAQY